MDDFISRKALCEYALNQKDKSVTPNDIMRFPSAQPQRTGKWVQIEESIKVSNYKCSECGRTVWDDRGYSPYIDYPYCHCGAKMEGE